MVIYPTANQGTNVFFKTNLAAYTGTVYYTFINETFKLDSERIVTDAFKRNYWPKKAHFRRR